MQKIAIFESFIYFFQSIIAKFVIWNWSEKKERGRKPVDELDLTIVKRLQQDGRAKFLKLAKELDVSEGTIRNRVKLLEDQKVILQYSAVVDPRKIGFDAVAHIGLDIEPLKFLKVVEALTRLEEITYLATSTGEHMVLMEVWMRNQEEVTRFINERIAVMDGVTKISPTIVLERFTLKKREEPAKR